MGVQLIFVVETDEKCKSDWNYIKATIERFYSYNPAHIRLKPVYMSGKNNYKRKKKEIDTLIRKYNGSAKNNQSIVIYCFDCDEYDTRREDSIFLEEAKEFCQNNEYRFVWFCKDIERVYLKKKVADRDKNTMAAIFTAKKMISEVDPRDLSVNSYGINKSNLLCVLDRFNSVLIRK